MSYVPRQLRKTRRQPRIILKTDRRLTSQQAQEIRDRWVATYNNGHGPIKIMEPPPDTSWIKNQEIRNDYPGRGVIERWWARHAARR